MAETDKAAGAKPLALPLARLGAAAATIPRRRDWLETALLLAAFAAVAWPLAGRAGIIGGSWLIGGDDLPLLALRALLAPALLEESLFRVLPNPHPKEAAVAAIRRYSGALSLAAYILVHPLVGVVNPALRATFLDPVFLTLVALLGALCLTAYRRSGSLWPPLVLHWVIVVGWLGLGGRGPLPLPL